MWDGRDEPIIKSALDIDFYKFPMAQFMFHRYADVPVRFSYINRTSKVRIGDVIDASELKEQLDYVMKNVRFGNSDLHYLRGTNEYGERMFKEDYLEFLKNYRFPDYKMNVKDGILHLDFSGKWAETTYWETIALSIISELRSRAILRKMSRAEKKAVFATGHIRLMEKIRKLRTRPWITVVDFGTRRRFLLAWHEHVVEVMAEELPEQFRGTSNVLLAQKYNLLPMGTNAHELSMVMSCLDRSSDGAIIASQRRLLREWWDEYGWGLSIALDDTYGSPAFRNLVMTPEQARDWKGFRQDSGDPIEYGYATIKYYKDLGIDPKEKLIIFSDGLDPMMIFRIDDAFNEKIKLTYGWGTNLTNDLGVDTLSMVVKIAEANGFGAVKLSNNIAKATGKAEDVERFKRIFGYNNLYSEECRY